MLRDSHASGEITIDPHWKVGIVYASYYPDETEALVAGACSVLADAGIAPEQVRKYRAPGSFEIPLLGAALAERGSVDALIGIGIIVEGATHHARLLAEQSARGIMDVQLRFGIPFAFEILYVRDRAHATQRATGPANKGAEAAYAVLHSLTELKRIRADAL